MLPFIWFLNWTPHSRSPFLCKIEQNPRAAVLETHLCIKVPVHRACTTALPVLRYKLLKAVILHVVSWVFCHTVYGLWLSVSHLINTWKKSVICIKESFSFCSCSLYPVPPGYLFIYFSFWVQLMQCHISFRCITGWFNIFIDYTELTESALPSVTILCYNSIIDSIMLCPSSPWLTHSKTGSLCLRLFFPIWLLPLSPPLWQSAVCSLYAWSLSALCVFVCF